jgi:excisionase family DNA binding protein
MPPFLSVPSAAAYLSLTPKSMYHRIARRTVPFIKQGRRILFDQAALDRWMSRAKIDATNAPPRLSTEMA